MSTVQPERRVAPAAPGAGSVVRLLVVDDSEGDRRLVRAWLAESPHARFEVEEAASLTDALRRLEGYRPDAVLLDLGLPDSSGKDTYRSVLHEAPDVPVVIWTGSEEEGDADDAIREGAHNYLVKGTVPGSLLSRLLHQAVERHRLRAELHERVKELQGLSAVLGELQDPTPADVVLPRVADHLVEAIQFPSIAGAEVICCGEVHPSTGFPDRIVRSLETPIVVGGREVGGVRVVYREDRPFLIPEEQGLVESVAEGISVWLERRKSAAALAESEARFRRLTENAVDVIFRARVRPSLAYEYVSPAVEPLTGYPPQDFYDDPELVLRITHPEDRERLIASRDSPEEIAEPLTIRWSHRDGSTRWLELRRVPLLDRDGVLEAVEGIARDVTARVEAEQALWESERRFRRLAQNAADGIYRYRLTLRPGFEYVNPALAEMTGYTPEELYENAALAWGMLRPEDVARVAEALSDPSSLPGIFEADLVRRDGSSISIEARSVPVLDDDGRLVAVEGIIRDVTAQREAETALEDHRLRLQGLFDNALDMFLIVDDEGRYVDVNPAAAEVLGFERDELIGRSIADLTPPAAKAELPEAWRAFLAAGQMTGQYALVRKDGTVIETEYRATPNIVPGLHLSVARDVTERNRVLRALAESEGRFRELVENIDAVFWIVDVDRGTTEYVSPGFERTYGVATDEQYRNPTGFLERVHADDREAVVRAFLGCVESGGYELEYRVVHPDGSVRWMHDRSSPVVDDGGRARRLVGVAQDVTLRKEIEERLTRSEERFRALVQNSADIIAVVGGDTSLTYASPASQRILGYDPEEMVGRTMLDLVHPDDVERVATVFGEGLQSPGLNVPATFRMAHAEGGWRTIEAVSNNRIDDPAVEGVVVNAHDVSELVRVTEELERNLDLLRRTDDERRRLLERLVRAQEEERRRISTDIHDDSVQAMTAVTMRLQMLRNAVDEPAQLEVIDRLQATVSQAIARLRNVLLDLRPPELDRGGLVAALRSYTARLFAGTPTSVEIEPALDEEPDADGRTIVYRIVQEALLNAWKHARASRVTVGVESREKGVLVQVRDDGIGFDPQTDLGSGAPHIGIADMRERAEMAGGWLTVGSIPGQGTTISFWVPVHGDASSSLRREAG